MNKLYKLWTPVTLVDKLLKNFCCLEPSQTKAQDKAAGIKVQQKKSFPNLAANSCEKTEGKLGRSNNLPL